MTIRHDTDIRNRHPGLDPRLDPRINIPQAEDPWAAAEGAPLNQPAGTIRQIPAGGTPPASGLYEEAGPGVRAQPEYVPPTEGYPDPNFNVNQPAVAPPPGYDPSQGGPSAIPRPGDLAVPPPSLEGNPYDPHTVPEIAGAPQLPSAFLPPGDLRSIYGRADMRGSEPGPGEDITTMGDDIIEKPPLPGLQDTLTPEWERMLDDPSIEPELEEVALTEQELTGGLIGTEGEAGEAPLVGEATPAEAPSERKQQGLSDLLQGAQGAGQAKGPAARGADEPGGSPETAVPAGAPPKYKEASEFLRSLWDGAVGPDGLPDEDARRRIELVMDLEKTKLAKSASLGATKLERELKMDTLLKDYMKISGATVKTPSITELNATIGKSVDESEEKSFRENVAANIKKYEHDNESLARDQVVAEAMINFIRRGSVRTQAHFMLGMNIQPKEYVDKQKEANLAASKEGLKAERHRMAIFEATGEILPSGLTDTQYTTLSKTLSTRKEQKLANQKWVTEQDRKDLDDKATRTKYYLEMVDKQITTEGADRTALIESLEEFPERVAELMGEIKGIGDMDYDGLIKKQKVIVDGLKIQALANIKASKGQEVHDQVVLGLLGKRTEAGLGTGRLSGGLAVGPDGVDPGKTIPWSGIEDLARFRRIALISQMLQRHREQHPGQTKAGWVGKLMHSVANLAPNIMGEWASSEYATFRQLSFYLLNDYVNAMTGKQLSIHETERLKSTVPQQHDPDHIYTQKLDNMMIINNIAYKSLALTAAAGGYDVHGVINQMPVAYSYKGKDGKPTKARVYTTLGNWMRVRAEDIATNKTQTKFLLKADNMSFVPVSAGPRKAKDNPASPFYDIPDTAAWGNKYFNYYTNTKPGREKGNALTNKDFTKGTMKSNKVTFEQAHTRETVTRADGSKGYTWVQKEGIFPQRSEAFDKLSGTSDIHKHYEEETGKKVDRSSYEHLPAERHKPGGSILPISREGHTSESIEAYMQKANKERAAGSVERRWEGGVEGGSAPPGKTLQGILDDMGGEGE